MNGNIECGKEWEPRPCKGMGILNMERNRNLERWKKWEYWMCKWMGA